MINYQDLILNNNQFKELCNQEINCNSFLFESMDDLFLENFSYCYAQRLLCTNNSYKPCKTCIQCQKVTLLKHSDLHIYPKNNKNIVVDDIKDLIENINLTPIESNIKVFILNDFSTATTQAQNKLLKILEEPPKNTYIFLNVTNINKVLPTVISRCKKIRLLPLSKNEIQNGLNNYSNEKVSNIIDVCQGSLTKAVNYVENDDFSKIFEFCLNTLINMQDSRKLIKFSNLFNNNKKHFEIALEIFESFFRDVLMLRLNKNELVQNKNIINDLINFSQFLDADAVDLLIKKIYSIKKQMEFNCNFVLLVDNFLLYYLEVKYLCNKK